MSVFRSNAVTNTNTTIKSTGATVQTVNIINRHNAAIFVKFYDSDVASFQDTPIRTYQVASSSYFPATPMVLSMAGLIFSTGQGLSIRAVTESADNGNTAPTTLPIIEVDYI